MESLEAPRVVHVRTTDMLSKENVYAQVTVRLLTRQVTTALVVPVVVLCHVNSTQLNSCLIKTIAGG